MAEHICETNWKQVEASRGILARSMRDEAYSAVVCGHEYVVFPGVFPANRFYSTEFFTRELQVRIGDEVLEIGCGMGVTSIELAKRGAGRVVATDICEAAVRNTEANIHQHGMSRIIEVRHGGLYEPIQPGEKFDLVYWNIPFIYVPDEFQYISPAERSIFDPGYRHTRGFISGAAARLKPHARLSLGFGDFGNTEALHRTLSENGFAWQVVAEMAAMEGGPVRFQLYEAVRDGDFPDGFLVEARA